jgi:hypothetical protein
MGHVYARLTGHGLALVPCWPYTFERPDAESEAVVVTNWREDGPAKALVDPSDAHTLPGIVDVGPGPDHPFWVIETTTFKAAWPAGFRVESTLDPFHLVGEHDASIYVQGPAQLAGPDAMVGPGQTVVARRTVGGQRVQAIELAARSGVEWMMGLD